MTTEELKASLDAVGMTPEDAIERLRWMHLDIGMTFWHDGRALVCSGMTFPGPPSFLVTMAG